MRMVKELDHPVINVMPLSTKSYGRLGKPAMGLLNTLAATAAAIGVVNDTFVAVRELSIGLCRRNGGLNRL